MKVYVRSEIWYDYTRCDVNSISREFSTTPFDKSLSPSNGFYQYFEIEVPDKYTPEEALKIVKLAYSYDNSVSEHISLVHCEELLKHINK